MSAAIWITLVACVLGCYTAALNITLKSLSRKRLSDLLSERGKAERLDGFIVRLPLHMLATGTLRAACIITVVLAVLYDLEQRFPPAINDVSRLTLYLIASLIGGVLISVTIVAIPVSWAKYHREALIALSMPLLNGLTILLWPIVALLHVVDPVVRRMSGVDLAGNGQERDLSDEVLTIVADHESGAEVDEEQRDMLEAVFELPETTAGEIMTPRTEVEGIELHADLEKVKELLIEYGHSRIPVYDTNLDDIKGILYAKDMIRFVGDASEFDMMRVVREPFLVPESKSIDDLLTEFKQRKVHLAIVLDEYGGTAGLVTIEDILEEIVGEIRDEYEIQEEEPHIVRVNESTIEADARIHIDDLNDELDVEIPEDEDYDTLGGYVFSTLGHIPEVGETFDHESLKLTVTDAEKTKVKRVRIEKMSVTATSDEARP